MKKPSEIPFQSSQASSLHYNLAGFINIRAFSNQKNKPSPWCIEGWLTSLHLVHTSEMVKPRTRFSHDTPDFILFAWRTVILAAALRVINLRSCLLSSRAEKALIWHEVAFSSSFC